MKRATENNEMTVRDIRDIIRERLSHDPFSQEYVDSLVNKTLEEMGTKEMGA